MKFLTQLVESLHSSISRYPGVIKYLSSRGVFLSDIVRYKIGFSRVVKVFDDGSDDYKNFLGESHNGRDFESTVVFPIYNVLGQVVGLISRKVEDKVYKQFLSDEAKSLGCMFGFYQAIPTIYRTGVVYTTEGVFDCIPFASVAPNTVACLTSVLSESQYMLLSLFCDRVITVFDNDKAGRMGTMKAQKELLDLNRVGLPNISSLSIGNFKDPGSCLKYMSYDKFKDYIKKRLNPFVVGV